MTRLEPITRKEFVNKSSQWMKKVFLLISIWSALAGSIQSKKIKNNEDTNKTEMFSLTERAKKQKSLNKTAYDLRKTLILANDKTLIDNYGSKKDASYKKNELENKEEMISTVKKFQYAWAIKQSQGEWNQLLAPLSQEETEQVEKMLSDYTIRCGILKDKPIMEKIEYIAIHSTGSTKPEVITYLWKTGKVHYIVLEDWSIIQYLPSDKNTLAQQNHLGKWGDPISCASWNRNDQITFETIGIEVMAGPAKKWSEKQYESLQTLLRYLSNKYGVKKWNIISHTMVAYNPTKGMMRKYDPFDVERDKLDLPPNDIQINTDVLAWRIAPNLISMYKRLRKQNYGSDPWPWYTHEEAIDYMEKHYAWINYAILLHKDANKGQINPNAHLAENPERWESIQEIDATMKNYMPPKEIIKQKKTPHKKAKHKKR